MPATRLLFLCLGLGLALVDCLVPLRAPFQTTVEVAAGLAEPDKELQRYMTRSRILEEALKTVKVQMASVRSKQQESDDELLQRAEDAESRVSTLQAQVSSEMKRADRMRVSWQNEMVKVAERAELAENDARRWRTVAENAQRDVEKYVIRVKALEKALLESEQELGESLLATNAQGSDQDVSKLQLALEDAKRQIAGIEASYSVEVEALQTTIENLRGQVSDMQRERDGIFASAAGAASSSATAATAAASSISAGDGNSYSAVAEELKQQRATMQRQVELLEALFVELAVQGGSGTGTGTGAGTSGTSGRGSITPPQLPAAGDTLWTFPANSAATRTRVTGGQPLASSSFRGVESAATGKTGAASDAREVQTQQVVVDGNPYLIDEDNNLYTVDDHAFVRKLASSTKLNVRAGRAERTDSRSGRWAKDDVETEDERRLREARRAMRAEQVSKIGKRIQDRVGNVVGNVVGTVVGTVVGGARSGLAEASRGLFLFLVGSDSDADDEDEDGENKSDSGDSKNVVDVEAIELPSYRPFNGSKMRPSFLSREE